jgi:uncharacterized protein (UPF0335 family)
MEEKLKNFIEDIEEMNATKKTMNLEIFHKST